MVVMGTICVMKLLVTAQVYSEAPIGHHKSCKCFTEAVVVRQSGIHLGLDAAVGACDVTLHLKQYHVRSHMIRSKYVSFESFCLKCEVAVRKM